MSIVRKLEELRRAEELYRDGFPVESSAGIQEEFAIATGYDVRPVRRYYCKIPITLLDRYKALDPASSVEELEKLSNSSLSRIRGLVAQNPSTPQHLLFKLVKDSEVNVRRCIASHRLVSNTALAMLSDDVDLEIKQKVAGRLQASPQISPQYFQHLGIESFEIDKICLDKTLSAYAFGTRNVALRDPNVSAKCLEAIAYDKESIARYLVSLHPRTPVAALARLIFDPSDMVCEAARKNLRHSVYMAMPNPLRDRLSWDY